jgi:hypothetical protein
MQLLEGIARAHAPGCSPVEAIDRALELASAPDDEADIVSRMHSIEDLLMLVDEARRSDSAKMGAQLAKIAASLAGLHSSIRELAGEEG